MKLKFFMFFLIIAIIFLIAFENRFHGHTFSGASPYNYAWDGTSNFIKYLANEHGEIVLITKWIDSEFVAHKYCNYSCKILIIVSPEKEYRYDEINIIKKLFTEYGFNIVILDEGPYTNAILQSLGFSISIHAFNYIKIRKSVYEYSSDIVPGYIELVNRYDIIFSYVSPVFNQDELRCNSIAYANNVSVGVLCDNKVFVLGDGSIVTNAAIPSINKPSAYTLFIDSVVTILCKGNISKIVFFVESSKYRVRPLTLIEMIQQNYGGLKAFAHMLNPFRYMYVYETEFRNLSTIFLLLLTCLILITISLFTLHRYRIVRNKEEFMYTDLISYSVGYGRDVIKLVAYICREDENCRKNVSCVVREKIDGKCIKKLNTYLSRNRMIRKKIIDLLLHTSTSKQF